jgi:methionyl aminopeptidase
LALADRAPIPVAALEERGDLVTIESDRDLAGLRKAGRVVALALAAMKADLQPGMTTAELDAICAEVFERHGARSAPNVVYGFPGVNRTIDTGDLVKIDVTAELDGYVADAAVTVPLPPGPPVHERLRDCAEAALERAVAVARPGRPVNKIGRVVETMVRRQWFSVLPEFSGHGVGRTIHEGPTVPNYYDPRLKTTLREGLVVTIEPIISAGASRTVGAEDGWTMKTIDGSPVAHYEHTIVITRGSPIVLTAA